MLFKASARVYPTDPTYLAALAKWRQVVATAPIKAEGEVSARIRRLPIFRKKVRSFREKLSAAPKSTIASRWPQARSIRAAHAKEETANSRFRSR